MRPTIRQLEYLVELAECLSFRGAAARCHVTQPALSKQLQQLEAQLGLKLFERDTKRVLPTPAGREMAHLAKRLLVELDRMVEAGRGLGPALAGTLRIGVIPTIAPYLLPHVLPHIRQQFPQVRPLLREAKTGELVRELLDGGLDVLILAPDTTLVGVEVDRLFTDDFLLAAPANHPLASVRSLKPKDLRGHDVLLLDEGHCLRVQVLPLCQKSGANEVGDFRASSLATLVEMVASGVGVTLLPEMAADLARERSGIVVRPFADPPTRDIGLAWRPGSPRAREFKKLGRTILEAWAKKP